MGQNLGSPHTPTAHDPLQSTPCAPQPRTPSSRLLAFRGAFELGLPLVQGRLHRHSAMPKQHRGKRREAVGTYGFSIRMYCHVTSGGGFADAVRKFTPPAVRSTTTKTNHLRLPARKTGYKQRQAPAAWTVTISPREKPWSPPSSSPPHRKQPHECPPQRHQRERWKSSSSPPEKHPNRSIPSGGGVVLPERLVVPQQRQALPDGGEALGHVVAQRVNRLERVRLCLQQKE